MSEDATPKWDESGEPMTLAAAVEDPMLTTPKPPVLFSARPHATGIGCESPLARGAEPHPARFAAFLFLVTSYGGQNGEAQASPVTLRVPRSLTPVLAAARCESWSAVVLKAQLEIIMTMKRTPTPNEAACRSLFGETPEDVISPIKSAADALGWLEELFNTIKREALDQGNSYRIKHLAEAGAYLASDIGNFADCQHETMIERLRTAGVIPTQGATA